jgi:anti-sigma B factor antagonist
VLDSGYDVVVAHVDGQAEIGLVGEFDLAAAADLRRELIDRVAGVPVVVDMADVSFVDSSSLAVFLHAANIAESSGTSFRLVNVTGSVRKVLEITGTLEVLTGSC